MAQALARKPATVVWIIVPQFGVPLAKQEEAEGLILEESAALDEEHNVQSHVLFPRQGSLMSIQDLLVTYPERLSKGLAVRLSLLGVLEWVDDRRGPMGRSHTWVVMVDGSGAYENQIGKILEVLRQKPVVLGHRINDSGMSNERTQIELFEKYLLERCLDETTPLPDCQEGIWGIRVDMLQSLPLTASGYGLEFDLTACVLKSLRLRFDFAAVEVSAKNRAKSSFDRKQSIEKLRFIVAKLALTEPHFLMLWSEYDGELDAGYKEDVKRALEASSFKYSLFSPRT